MLIQKAINFTTRPLEGNIVLVVSLRTWSWYKILNQCLTCIFWRLQNDAPPAGVKNDKKRFTKMPVGKGKYCPFYPVP